MIYFEITTYIAHCFLTGPSNVIIDGRHSEIKCFLCYVFQLSQ